MNSFLSKRLSYLSDHPPVTSSISETGNDREVNDEDEAADDCLKLDRALDNSLPRLVPTPVGPGVLRPGPVMGKSGTLK